jgi:murein DD-endopeptidase MepM/ murein hydrolase activator NlpD
LAIIDATVVAIRDHMAEKEKVSENQKQSIEDAPGNYVVLELSDHRFAFYEHLKPGSIHARVGDSVHRGQAIAALGFTGLVHIFTSMSLTVPRL